MLVLFLLGFLGSVYGIIDHIRDPDECEMGIITCQPLQKPFTTKLNNDVLFETEWELNEQCRKQVSFNKCMQQARKNCINVGTSPLAKTMLENRLFAKEFCVKDFAWKRLYLENANCINKYSSRLLNACKVALFSGKDPDIADIGGLCRYQDAMLYCQVAKFEFICGPIAADLYKKLMLLNGAREYLCNNLAPEDSVTENGDQLDDPEIIYVGKNPEHVFDIIKNIPKTSDSLFDKGSRRYLAITDEGFIIIEESDSKVSLTTGHQVESDIDPDPSTDQVSEENYGEKRTTDYKRHGESTKKQQLHNSNKYDSSVEAEVLGEITNQQQNATFTVFQIMDDGSALNLGSGQVTVNWNLEHCISNNLYCSWMDKLSSGKLFKCSIHIEPLSLTEANYFTAVHNLLVNKTWMAPLILHKPSIKFEPIIPSKEETLVSNYKPCQDGSFPILLGAKYNPVNLPKNLYSFAAYDENVSHLLHDIHRMGSIELQEESLDVEKISELPPVEMSTLIYEHLDGLVEVSDDEIANAKYALEVSTDHDVEKKLHVQGETPLSHFASQDSYSPFDKQYLSRMGDLIDALTSESDFLLQTEEDKVEFFSSENRSSRKSSCEEVDVCEKSHPGSCSRQDLCKDSTENKYKPGTYVDLRDIEVIDPLNVLDTKNVKGATNYVIVGKPYLPDESEVESYADSSENYVDALTEETTIVYSIEDLLENLVPEVSEENKDNLNTKTSESLEPVDLRHEVHMAIVD